MNDAPFLVGHSGYSDHIAIEETMRNEFFEKISNTIDKHGGTITICDTIDLQMARKRV